MPRGGAKPGERRGGRQKGTRNKRTLAVIDRLDVMGCDPIAGMARGAIKGEITLTAWLAQHSGSTLGPPSER